MLIRLLYRLVLQRLNDRTASRGRDTPVKEKRSVRIGNRNEWQSPAKQSRLLRIFLLTSLVVVVVFAWRFLTPALWQAEAKAAPASLSIDVLSSPQWPVVVYLQGDNDAGFASPGARVDKNDAQAVSLQSTNGTFEPRFQVVPLGSAIKISNQDPIAHNTHVFYRGDTIFNVALPYSGKVVTKRLPGPGLFEVRCDHHPGMQAWLFSPPDRHYKVLHHPGTLDLSDIPPGDYTLHLWRAPGKLTYRALTLNPGQAKNLKLN